MKKRTRYVTGALCGLAAVSIWAGWMAVTRFGLTTSLTVCDLTMLRFGTAALLLLTVLFQHGLALDRLGWWRSLVLVFGAGAPYSLVAASGLRFAPAVHGGVLIPGVMPLFVALLSAVFLKETFSTKRRAGYILIGLGVVTIASIESLISAESRVVGLLLFLLAALMWPAIRLF